MKGFLLELRKWAIYKLAGDMPIVINCHFQNSHIGFKSSQKALIADCIFGPCETPNGVATIKPIGLTP